MPKAPLKVSRVVLGHVPRGAQRPVEGSRGMSRHQPAGRPLPVTFVVEAQRGADGGVDAGGVLGRGLGITGLRHGLQYR